MLIGCSLILVAGTVDAGGVLLMGQPTSHLSSTVSGIGNHPLAGAGPALQDGLLAFVAFTARGVAS